MIKKIKNSLIFYIKTLLVYGVILAFFYCPAMQYEQKYREASAELPHESGVMAIDDVKQNAGEIVYHPSRIINVIEQCRALECRFQVNAMRFGSCEGSRVEPIKALFEDVKKVSERLDAEKKSFSDYIAGTCFRKRKNDEHRIRFECSKGRCKYNVMDRSIFDNDKEARSRKVRNVKSRRYASQVLERYDQKMKHILRSLGSYIDKIKRADAEARARSEIRAKELST